jgi:hypothetical protein
LCDGKIFWRKWDWQTTDKNWNLGLWEGEFYLATRYIRNCEIWSLDIAKVWSIVPDTRLQRHNAMGPWLSSRWTDNVMTSSYYRQRSLLASARKTTRQLSRRCCGCTHQDQEYVLLLKHAAATDFFFAFLPFGAGPRICPGIYILAGFDTIENMLANLMYH